MIQIGRPIPEGLASCGEGHRPQLVESRGAPRGHRIGDPCPTHWHVECFLCGEATLPVTKEHVALLHWQANPVLFRIPLAHLPKVREHIASQAAVAA